MIQIAPISGGLGPAAGGDMFWQKNAAGIPKWRLLEKTLLTELAVQRSRPGFYDLVQVLVDSEGRPQLLGDNDPSFLENDVPTLAVFTSPDRLRAIARPYSSQEIKDEAFAKAPLEGHELKTFMLGELVHLQKDSKTPVAIKVDPVLERRDDLSWGAVYRATEVLFCPIEDPLTRKLMVTHPDIAKALLAIHPADQERFGIEIVFHIIAHPDLPEDPTDRESALKEHIHQLAFMAPRVPIKKGSASLYCVILNLENAMEETAFVRGYETYDSHSDVVFVTSSLELLTGELEQIAYNGDKIDTIFAPLIHWQCRKMPKPHRPTIPGPVPSFVELDPWQISSH